MKLNKLQNAKRNLIFGVVLKLYQTLIPFFFRTIILHTLGVKYLGLNNLFVSVLQVLNLAELGVGSAMTFAMYKPIAEDDTDRICALMALYRLYYRIIGALILAVGVGITPLIPKLIKGEVPPDLNVYVLYLMNLLATVLTYWLFAYKNSVLQAHQRQDVVSKVAIGTGTVKYVFQLLALYITHNYYYYVICILVTQILSNIITAIISDRLFPQYHPTGKLPKEERDAINHKIRDLFTSKVGGVIVNSADTIVISAFLGLEILAIYQNYFYIISAILSFMIIINNSILAGVGNSLITKSAEENYNDFRIFSFLEMWIIGFCCCCFAVLFQPFMTVWMGENMLFDFSVVILFCVYFVGYEYVMLMNVYKDAAGIWHDDRLRPLIAGLANLVLNLILVRFIGIYGILLSTIISVYFISAPWITINVFRTIFKGKKISDYLVQIGLNLVVAIVGTALACSLFRYVPDGGWILVFVKGALAAVFINLFFGICYIKHPMLKKSLEIVKRMFTKKKR